MRSKLRMVVTGPAAVLLASSPALASEQASGNITQVTLDNNGGPYVFLTNGARTTPPACATDPYWAIATPSGDNAKAMWATVLTAYALGKLVKVVGTGNCDPAAPTREKILYMGTN